MKETEQKKQEQGWRRTHFGPEETEDVIKERMDNIKRKKAFLSKELKKQIEERAKLRNAERVQEIGFDKMSETIFYYGGVLTLFQTK